MKITQETTKEIEVIIENTIKREQFWKDYTNGEIIDWAENAIVKERIQGAITIYHILEKLHRKEHTI